MYTRPKAYVGCCLLVDESWFPLILFDNLLESRLQLYIAEILTSSESVKGKLKTPSFDRAAKNPVHYGFAQKCLLSVVFLLE